MMLQRWPRFRTKAAWAGLTLMVGSLIAASFANSVTFLLVFQGITYGMGGALIYCPYLTYIDTWFDERKGIAYGIQWAGLGVGGIVTPLIMKWGLAQYGFRAMLRAWAVVLVCFHGNPFSFATFLIARIVFEQNLFLVRGNKLTRAACPSTVRDHGCTYYLPQTPPSPQHPKQASLQMRTNGSQKPQFLDL